MALVQVSVRELKHRLSHYLRLTKAGQTVEITERRKPIGRIVPIIPPLEERLNAMATLGLLARGEGTLPPRPPVARARLEKRGGSNHGRARVTGANPRRCST